MDLIQINTQETVDTGGQFSDKSVTKISSYKQLILAALFIFIFSLVTSIVYQSYWHGFMQYMMAGYFLIFGIAQSLAIKQSARMLRKYDIFARIFPFYGYILPVIQIILGVVYVISSQILIVNLIALVVIISNTAGVLDVILSKRKVRCSCLGDVLNVPVGKVTLIENLFMLSMLVWMLQYSIF